MNKKVKKSKNRDSGLYWSIFGFVYLIYAVGYSQNILDELIGIMCFATGSIITKLDVLMEKRK